MCSPWIIISFLGVAAVSLSTWLQPWFQGWSGNRTKSTDILTVALGDSRKLFAKHFYVKADAYFHSGYYPTIFDTRPDSKTLHIAATQSGHQEEGADFLGAPKDWIDRFSRNFYPSTHRHLGEGGGRDHHDHGEKEGHHDEGAGGGEERELLPWLKLSAELDPQRPETYVVAAFWLRSRLGNVDQAEQFLRRGLQANPLHYEILFELGQIYYDNRKDPLRARNLWELALRNWRERDSAHEDPNLLVLLQILGHLGRLEEEQKNYAKAIVYLDQLKLVSPSRPAIEKWIGELKQKIASTR